MVKVTDPGLRSAGLRLRPDRCRSCRRTSTSTPTPATRRYPAQDTFNLNAAQLGAHTVSESAVAGWSLTDLDCTGAGRLRPSLGMYGHARHRRRRDGGLHLREHQARVLTVVKVTVPASDPQDFDFDLTGAGRAGRPRPRHRRRQRHAAQPGHVQPERRRSWAPIPSASRPSPAGR